MKSNHFISEKSFFEHLGIANIERVHTEVLAWIFSDQCLAISTEDKNKFISNLIQCPKLSETFDIHTEINNIDLFIESENTIVIIENKLKSSQHSNQLEKYRKYVEKEFKNHKHYFLFLTLAPEVPHDKIWEHVSYNKIYDLLTALKLKEHKHKVIIEDYILYLNKLLSSLNSFLKEPSKYESVFINGKLKKKDKFPLTFNNPIEEFISTNQLETIFQKAFLSKLLASEKLSKLNVTLTDTRGTALLDFQIKRNIKLVDRQEMYTTFIQLQNDSIKFAFAVQEKYEKSKKEWVEPVLKIFKDFKKSSDNLYYRYNPPTSKAYMSISRKTTKPYWKMNNNEISNLILYEIKSGKRLTEILIKKLN